MRKEVIIPREFQASKTGTFFFTSIKFLFVAFLIALPFKWFVAQPFVVSGVSMAPTFVEEEYLVIDKVTYRYHKPQRGDILIFEYPLDPSFYFIKRIVALPGETVSVDDDRVAIVDANGESRTLDEPYVASVNPKKHSSTITLAKDEYFVLGDNRDESSDSREWGPLQEKFIVGRALFSIYPMSRAGFLPGEFHSRK